MLHVMFLFLPSRAEGLDRHSLWTAFALLVPVDGRRGKLFPCLVALSRPFERLGGAIYWILDMRCRVVNGGINGGVFGGISGGLFRGVNLKEIKK